MVMILHLQTGSYQRPSLGDTRLHREAGNAVQCLCIGRLLYNQSKRDGLREGCVLDEHLWGDVQAPGDPHPHPLPEGEGIAHTGVAPISALTVDLRHIGPTDVWQSLQEP